jgi:phosphohistidine phosphatase SixA
LQQADTHYFVLMRHAIAPGTGDPANFQLDDCTTQRNLSDEGRDQARQTGDLFRQQGVEVTQVLSSQWCRCLETAELMALSDVQPFPPLNSFFRDRATEPQQTQAVREFMREQADMPGVTVMVTHFVNIGALSGSGVSSGAMVVMQVNEQEQIEVVGQLEAL